MGDLILQWEVLCDFSILVILHHGEDIIGHGCHLCSHYWSTTRVFVVSVGPISPFTTTPKTSTPTLQTRWSASPFSPFTTTPETSIPTLQTRWSAGPFSPFTTTHETSTPTLLKARGEENNSRCLNGSGLTL